jgi:polysaccharide pyruvyl transferase WcaK-like protein
VGILRQSGVEDCRVYSYNLEQDKEMHVDEIAPIHSYAYSPKPVRGFYRYVLKNPIKAHVEAYSRIVKKEKPTYLVCVGGDTYCFDKPYGNFALNLVGEKYGIPTVLWGCSVDERVLMDDVRKQDIRKYKHIVARESLTFEILKQCITPEQTLWLACDPAFHLETKETELPALFASGDTVGINLSPYFIKNNTEEEKMICRNIRNFITYLLEKTSFNICFIPHVYAFDKKNQDIEVIDCFYQEYTNEPRVSFLSRNISCSELKYVISRCRFFVGARTHSCIAAYSTGVPTLALSYSIKSLGIAKDIFGDNKGNVLPKTELKRRDCLTETFVESILGREEEIRETYRSVMPAYKQSILNAANGIFSEDNAEKSDK